MTPTRVPLIVAAAIALLALAPAALADDDCPDLGFETEWLNAFYCARLRSLAEGPAVPPDRSVGVPDDEAAELIDGVPLVREAFHADPRSTLDLIDRIRAAGGRTQR